MGKGIGRLIQAGIAKETTRGTAETAATYWLPWASLSVDDKFEDLVEEQAYGVIEDSIGQKRIKNWSEMKIGGVITDKSFPLVLLATLGALSTGDNADSDATIKDHTITVAQSAQHQALTLFVDDPLGGQDYKHALGVIQSLEIKYEVGKFIEYSADIKAKKGATATLTPAVTAENKFLPQHLVFKVAANLAGLTAASALSVKSLSLKIDKSIEEDIGQSTDPVDFLNKQFVITGQVEATWQNESDFKTAALASTVKALRIDLLNADVTIGTAAKPEIKIDLAKVTFTELARKIDINGIVTQTVSFKAHYSSTDSKMITILATNAVASY